MRLFGGIFLAFAMAFGWGAYKLGNAPTVAAITVEGVPPRALDAYVSAARKSPCPTDWRTLAAIGFVETGHGSHGGAVLLDDGTTDRPIVSRANAHGPMQWLLGPDSWGAYATDGDGDGAANVEDIDDAASATAAWLCRFGLGKTSHAELFGRYNAGSDWVNARGYADAASAYERTLPEVPTASGTATMRGANASAVLRLLGDEMATRWAHLGVRLADTPTLASAHRVASPVVDVVARTLNPDTPTGQRTACDDIDVSRMRPQTVEALREIVRRFGCPTTPVGGRPIVETWRDPAHDSIANGNHPAGLAIDLSSTDTAWMRRVAEWWTGQPWARCVIHVRHIWQVTTREWRPYVGDGPHEDHLHLGVLADGGKVQPSC
jgi:hypothetical protein